MFFSKTKHEFAVSYYDTSILENLHCSRLFTILNSESVNLFSQIKDVNV